MAHGTGDSTHTTTGEGGSGGADATPTRDATGRFAAARNALTRGRGGADPRDARDESKREHQARVARALRAADGGDDEGAETDWRAVSLFGAGLTIGALLGAGVALLLAPASGFETRMRLVRTARQTGDRLRKGSRRGARDLKRGVSRTLTQSRWAAEDAWERRRRRHRGRDEE